MTTKTDITLPPLPRHMDSVTAEEFDRRVLAWGRAAVEADRKRGGEPVKLCDCERGHNGMGMAGRECDCPGNNPHPAEPVKVPSDLANRLRIKAGMITMGEKIAWGSDVDLMLQAAQALEDYGQPSQPSASAEPVAVLRYDHGVPGRENEMPSVVSCNRLPDGDYLVYAAQAQPTMPALTDAMRAVLRNEHCVYESEDALYAALCDAAQAQPQQSENQEALADTQRAIIEAAERRGYARAEAENVGYRTDAGRYRFIRILTGDRLDAAIDAARAAKGE